MWMSLLLIFRDVWFTGSIARGPGRSFVTGSLGALRDHDLPGICGDYGHRSLREIVWRAAGAMTGTMSTVISRIDFTHITISAHKPGSSLGVDGTRRRYRVRRNRDSYEA